MDRLFQDIRFSLRSLIRNPGFAATCLITLALGIGINAAIFSVVNSLLLKPLPFTASERLVNVWERDPQLAKPDVALSASDFNDLKEQCQSFEGLSVYATRRFNLTQIVEPEQIQGARVSSDLFALLGVSPVLGRVFGPEDDRAPVAVIGHRLWRGPLGGDNSVLGKSIALDGKQYTVIGVMPETFTFPIDRESVDVWVPIAFTPAELSNRAHRGFRVIGRLRPLFPIQTIQSEVNAIAERLEKEYPDTNEGVSIRLISMQEDLVGDVKPALIILFGAVVFVLAIACVNLANLLLARSVTREREIALRSALGATQGRLFRQLLTESLLLAMMGGAAGLAVARLGIEFLKGISTRSIPRLSETTIDARVLVFTLTVSILTGVAFGLAPAFQSSRRSVIDSRGHTGSLLRNIAFSILVVVEVALSVVLLAGAGLLLNSFIRVNKVQSGLNASNVLTMQVSLTRSRYASDAQIRGYFQELLQRLRVNPTVESAGAISNLPLTQSTTTVGFSVEGRTNRAAEELTTNLRLASSGYFQAMGIPLLSGRDFSDQDGGSAPQVVIINETMARKYFPEEGAIGKRISVTIGNQAMREVIGVVGDVRHAGLTREAGPEVYLPYLQLTFSGMSMVIRTKGDPAQFAPTARAEALAVDGNQPVSQLKTMEDYLAESVSAPRFNTILLNIFALLALTMAVVGIYGVLAYTVNYRTREIGVRMALGATRLQVLRLIVGQALFLSLIGGILGLVGALFVTRVLSVQLFGVTPRDPVTFLLAYLLLVVAALLASLRPAYRATTVDPMVALRYE